MVSSGVMQDARRRRRRIDATDRNDQHKHSVGGDFVGSMKRGMKVTRPSWLSRHRRRILCKCPVELMSYLISADALALVLLVVLVYRWSGKHDRRKSHLRPSESTRETASQGQAFFRRGTL